MTLRSFTCTNFRCLSQANLDLAPGYNLIYGANASGKTSLLEAVAYLGRGKSFRGATAERLVRHGATEFVLFGKAVGDERETTLGVRNGRAGLEISVDGDRNVGVADLAKTLPLQIVDPEVHSLVAGGPEERRRYLDWIAFHVEHGYLELWRRFRRALKQRNAALKQQVSPGVLKGWDQEFVDAAGKVHAVRQRCLALSERRLKETAERLLGSGVGFDYQRGWSGESLLEALERGRDRDFELGTTRAGPQRADLRLSYDERQARKLVSRGQQKLLACTMILAATEVVQSQLERPLLLLMDDPAAELDEGSLEGLMGAVEGLGCQVIATALQAERGLFAETPRTFHVEHGVLRQVD